MMVKRTMTMRLSNHTKEAESEPVEALSDALSEGLWLVSSEVLLPLPVLIIQ